MNDHSLKPYFHNANVSIFMVSSDAYVPYCGVTLQAIVKHSCSVNNYDVVIGGTNISTEHKKKLSYIVANHPNFSVRFFNVANYLPTAGFRISKVFPHVTEETMYRLLIPEIFSNYKKVLYLDVDLIPLEDVATLYNVDMGDAWVGGCQDFGIMRCSAMSKSMKKYFESQINVNPITEYINTGVSLFNIKELNKNGVARKWMETATKSSYKFYDQDIINKVCKGHVYRINSEWNETNKRDIEGVPAEYIKKQRNDVKNHRIVHWCNSRKPWLDPTHETGHLWWSVARISPFYEEILYRNIKDGVTREVGTTQDLCEMKRMMRDVAQLGDFRRKLKRVRWKIYFSWGKKKQRYLKRKKQLKKIIESTENFLKVK